MSSPPVPHAPGRRERKKQETRHTLELAALRLFVERGYDRTTVEDITEAADVSLRTFFRYFATKRDVLAGDLDSEAADLRAQLREQPADVPLADVVREGLRGFVERRGGEEGQELLRLRARIFEADPQLAGQMHATFTEVEQVLADEVGRRCGLDPARHGYPGLVAAVSLAALGATTMSWVRGHRTEPLADLVADALDQVAAGLPVPPPDPGRPG